MPKKIGVFQETGLSWIRNTKQYSFIVLGCGIFRTKMNRIFDTAIKSNKSNNGGDIGLAIGS